MEWALGAVVGASELLSTMRGGGVPFRMTGCKQTLTHAYDPVWRTQAVSYCFHCTHVGILDPLVDGGLNPRSKT